MDRIGFRTAAFAEWPIDRALAELARTGYDGVELCLEHPGCRPEILTSTDCNALAARCAGLGLDVASVSYHGDFEPPHERRANTLRAVDLVRPLGTDILIINGRRVESDAETDARQELEALLDDLLPRAIDLGVRVAIEPEPGLAIGNTAEMEALLERRDTPALGANLDVGHAFLTDDDVCASVRALGSAILHTHLEGMAAGVHKHLLPGEGDLDLAAVCRALRAGGYAGYYTVDLFAIADDPIGFAQKALSGMKGLQGD